MGHIFPQTHKIALESINGLKIFLGPLLEAGPRAVDGMTNDVPPPIFQDRLTPMLMVTLKKL